MATISRGRISKILIAIFGTGALAGVGISVFGVIPTDAPNVFVPCYGDTCVMCLAPSVAECRVLVRCGGEPCRGPIEGRDGDEYAGANGRLARGLRRAMERGALMTFHTDALVSTNAINDCLTQVYLDRDQRAAWRRTVDAAGVGSDVVDCRKATMPAKGKKADGTRKSFLARADDDAEDFPDDVVDVADFNSVDAGTIVTP